MSKRRLLIDTDTGTDDAVALVMALRDPNVQVEAITIVKGNVGVAQCTKNALMSIEVADTYAPPVYQGLGLHILNNVTKTPRGLEVHGIDGMGDLPMPEPKLVKQQEHAIDFLIRYIDQNPGELEMVTLGPATNLAWICLRSPETLGKLKHIYMMMGAGRSFGNNRPLAEGNAGMDPEALEIVLEHAHCPITLIGWDLCIDEYLFTEQDIERIYATGSKIAKFCLDINHTLVKLNTRRFGRPVIDFADPVAMAVALCPDIIAESITAHTEVVTSKGLAYGAIGIDAYGNRDLAPNATTCLKLHVDKLKECIISRIV